MQLLTMRTTFIHPRAMGPREKETGGGGEGVEGVGRGEKRESKRQGKELTDTVPQHGTVRVSGLVVCYVT